LFDDEGYSRGLLYLPQENHRWKVANSRLVSRRPDSWSKK
jgi:hypothetical protein